MIQIKVFSGYENGEEMLNAFLKELDKPIYSLTSVYNSILGGVDHVLVYYL